MFTEDLRRATGDEARALIDLRSLKRQGLIEQRTITCLRDRSTVDVIVVTADGKALLEHHREPDGDVAQKYYAGWVKPAEIWHDASLFRMCRSVESEIERDGARVVRIVLDDELKGRAYAALHEARQTKGERESRQAVATAQGLHLDERDRFVFPDVRLEVEDRDGTMRTLDLERVTEHYHRSHISGKAAAGFRMFGGSSSVGRGGTPRDHRNIEKLLR